jgi:uncharacterized membrane protein YkgB
MADHSAASPGGRGYHAGMAQKRHPSEPAFLRPGSQAEDSPLTLRARLPRRDTITAVVVRTALAASLGYLGALKLSPVAAHMIEPLVASSPALSWIYTLFSVEHAALAIGAIEVAAALLLLAGAFSPWLALAGSLLAIGVFVTTLSFLATMTNTFVTLPGFPLPAPSTTGMFLLKDVFLLGAAVWSLLFALRALRLRPPS